MQIFNVCIKYEPQLHFWGVKRINSSERTKNGSWSHFIIMQSWILRRQCISRTNCEKRQTVTSPSNLYKCENVSHLAIYGEHLWPEKAEISSMKYVLSVFFKEYLSNSQDMRCSYYQLKYSWFYDNGISPTRILHQLTHVGNTRWTVHKLTDLNCKLVSVSIQTE